MYKNKRIDSVLENAPSLRNVSQTFAILDELNRILHKFLPPHIAKNCHIGAIDTQKNLIILYLTDPAIGHIISSMANLILENFNNHHFSFAGIVNRVRPKHSGIKPVEPKHLEPKLRDKLTQLAISIDKIDLIEDEVDTLPLKEIDF
jgi:predicted double-glycine peptidase